MAVFKEINPEYAEWASNAKTNMILADIFDVLAQINANLVAIGSHKQVRNPKRYPRPGMQDENETKIGKNGLPVDELEEWFNKKREARKWQTDQK